MIRLKRVYEKAEVTDGVRVLVDRLWPRGVRRSTPNIDIWMRDVAPTDELRKWFSHDPKKWVSFKKRYRRELKEGKAFEELAEFCVRNDPVTLLYATSDTKRNNAVVLISELDREVKKIRKTLPRKKSMRPGPTVSLY
jgi:uncharacterized protein YeaO (DUF488 family)